MDCLFLDCVLAFIRKITHIHMKADVDKYSGRPTTTTAPNRKDNHAKSAFIIYQLIWKPSIEYQ